MCFLHTFIYRIVICINNCFPVGGLCRCHQRRFKFTLGKINIKDITYCLYVFLNLLFGLYRHNLLYLFRCKVIHRHLSFTVFHSDNPLFLLLVKLCPRRDKVSFVRVEFISKSSANVPSLFTFHDFTFQFLN